MRIQIAFSGLIPALKYGGTQRVIWSLGKELAKKGHKISFLAAPGSHCDFAELTAIKPGIPLEEQLDASADIVHFQAKTSRPVERPHVVTIHGNIGDSEPLGLNSIFVSRDHARRHGSDSFVYNGLDWDDYAPPRLDAPRDAFHFLGKAAWRVKNVKGAIDIAKTIPGGKLRVLGGSRLNLKMGFRLTLTPRARFYGMVGDETKQKVMQHSRGLIFPVRWPEPFGLAITESLYFGAPVYGTPYGSLPELVPPEVGFLSSSAKELAARIRGADYNPRVCHEYARDLFNSRAMAEAYLKCYERVLNGEPLNPTSPRAQRPRDWPLPWYK